VFLHINIPHLSAVYQWLDSIKQTLGAIRLFIGIALRFCDHARLYDLDSTVVPLLQQTCVTAGGALPVVRERIRVVAVQRGLDLRSAHGQLGSDPGWRQDHQDPQLLSDCRDRLVRHQDKYQCPLQHDWTGLRDHVQLYFHRLLQGIARLTLERSHRALLSNNSYC